MSVLRARKPITLRDKYSTRMVYALLKSIAVDIRSSFYHALYPHALGNSVLVEFPYVLIEHYATH